MLTSRMARWTLLGAGAVVVLVAAWAGWQAWRVDRDLDAAISHADAFRGAIAAGDREAVATELAALEESSAAAADRTSGPTWSLLTRLPVVGDDATGVRVASEVVRDLADDGLGPLAAVSDDLAQLLPRDGAVPLGRLHELRQPVADARRSFADAQERLAAEDASGYTADLRARYRDLEEQVGRAAAAMTSAERALELLPTMLGEDRPRRFLLVFQNNAEIRATGGLPGAVALLESEDGRVELGRQTSGAAFGRAEQLPLPLTPAETALYDDVLGAYFLSSNMTPDFPRAAGLWAARWEQTRPRDRIDGVIAIDTVALSYVLAATGPIEVDDVTLDAGNVVDVLLHGTYLRIEDPDRQDAFFAKVAATAFEQFTSGGGDPRGLLDGLARATAERRVLVHSFDPAEQASLAGTPIAGELVTDPAVRSPQVDVTVNDTTGAKMSYFLRYDVGVRATYCTDGVQGLTGRARIWSAAPADAARLPDYVTGGGALGTAPGRQLTTLRIYGPVGGTVDDVTLNAEPMDVIEVDQDGRPVAMTYVELGPGETVDLTWTMTGGEGQTAATELDVTPTVEKGTFSRTVPSRCG